MRLIIKENPHDPPDIQAKVTIEQITHDILPRVCFFNISNINMSDINKLMKELDDGSFVSFVIEFPIFLKRLEVEHTLRLIDKCPASILESLISSGSFFDLSKKEVQLQLVKRGSSYLKLIPDPDQEVLNHVIESYYSNNKFLKRE